jgi:hypothetical protein
MRGTQVEHLARLPRPIAASATSPEPRYPRPHPAPGRHAVARRRWRESQPLGGAGLGRLELSPAIAGRHGVTSMAAMIRRALRGA